MQGDNTNEKFQKFDPKSLLSEEMLKVLGGERPSRKPAPNAGAENHPPIQDGPTKGEEETGSKVVSEAVDPVLEKAPAPSPRVTPLPYKAENKLERLFEDQARIAKYDYFIKQPYYDELNKEEARLTQELAQIKAVKEMPQDPALKNLSALYAVAFKMLDSPVLYYGGNDYAEFLTKIFTPIAEVKELTDKLQEIEDKIKVELNKLQPTEEQQDKIKNVTKLLEQQRNISWISKPEEYPTLKGERKYSSGEY